MSRTLQEARIEGIGHEDHMVRSEALCAIVEERDPDAAAAILAIRQIEKHGWQDAFEFPNQIRHLPHTAESVKWVADWLVESAPATGKEEQQQHLNEWFCEAPVEWLMPQIDRFAETLKAGWPPLTESIRSNPVSFANPNVSFSRAVDRLEAAMWSGEKLRGELDTTLERCAANPEFPHTEIRRMEVICEALAARGECREEATGAWLDITAPDPELELGVLDYRIGAALMLIRFGKIRPPVERIVRLFEVDWDWLNELVEGAIVAGGNRDTLCDLLGIFPGLPWHAKLYLSSAMVQLRFDGFEVRLIELLQTEEADDIRARLARALAFYGSAQAVAATKEFIAEYPEDLERRNIMDLLCVDEILTGRDTLETRRHLQEMKRHYQQRKIRFANLEQLLKSVPGTLKEPRAIPLPFRPAAPRPPAGRNDPCPCGSGKKFKKCCGRG